MTEKVLFTGKTHNIGGRNGSTRSSDGTLDLKLSQPHPAAEQPSARGPHLLLGARHRSPAGRRLAHGHLRRRRLVRSLVQPGDDDDDALRVVRGSVRLGPAATPRSRPHLIDRAPHSGDEQ